MSTPNVNKILRAHPVSGRLGARMGSPNEPPDDDAELYLQRIRFVDGDYSADGVYWGSGGEPLWAAFTPDLSAIVYVRARNRNAATDKVLEDYPEVIIRGRRQPFNYMDCSVFPIAHVLGWRWETRTRNGYVYAQTRSEIKAMIRGNQN